MLPFHGDGWSFAPIEYIFYTSYEALHPVLAVVLTIDLPHNEEVVAGARIRHPREGTPYTDVRSFTLPVAIALALVEGPAEAAFAAVKCELDMLLSGWK